MKLSLVLLAGLFVLVLCDEAHHQHKKFKVEIIFPADKAFVKKQKQIMEIFMHVNQPSHFKEHVDIAKSYSINDHVDHYTKPEVVKQFVQYYKYGYFIHQGEIFSVFNTDHLEQAIALFKLFYYAKDYDTFYKTAVWARQNMNEGMFVYAFSVAVVHRPDTYGIALPPIYEVYPHYFHNSDTIHQAYFYKQKHTSQHSDQESKHTQGQKIQGHEDHEDQEHGWYRGYTVYANYSGHYLNLHPEQSLSYYMEDVGINAFYYYYNLYYPFWMCSEEYGMENDKRGELYYFVYQQMMARYYMERLSNGFGEIPYVDFHGPMETPYYPSMQYPNGLEFPTRPAFAKFEEYFYNYGQRWTGKGMYGYSHNLVHDFVSRINDAIDAGYAYDHDGNKVDMMHSKDGVNTLGNLIESNHDSPNHQYYGPITTYARHLFGYSYQPMDQHHVAPSAMEHFETSMRDPAFYQMYKRIVLKFQRFYWHKTPYTEKDLTFPGVKVFKMEVDPLITYHDSFYSDMSNAVFDNEHELQHDTFHIRAHQYRMNHKHFSYKIYVKSDKDTKASVKVFIGPKYDEYGRYINLTENRLNMMEIDHFTYEMKSGENVITRDCDDNHMFGPDRTPFADMYQQVVDAYEGRKEYKIDGTDNFFPISTKGSRNGSPYHMYVFVYKYEPYQGKDQQEKVGEYFYPKVGSGGMYVDNAPLGYPFERFIKFEEMWNQIPNSYFQEVRIFHKHAEEAITTKTETHLAYWTARRAIKDLLSEKHISHWAKVPGLRQWRMFIGEPSWDKSIDFIKLGRNHLRWIVGLFKGHCPLMRHLSIGMKNDPDCRRCGEEEETDSFTSMKLTLILLASILALAAASVVRKTVIQLSADKAFLKKQRDVLLILKNINQPSYYKEFVDIGKSYDVSKVQDRYLNKEAMQQFLEYCEYGTLPRGVIFSLFNEEHLEEAITFFKVLYSAKDYDTFYNTAVWARQNLNEGLFLYSFVVAVVHRQDTHDVVLPPIYEIYPHYFINSEVINQAYRYKQEGGQITQDGSYHGYTINSNYSGYYLNLHPEQSLSYFTEDVGVLSYYYYYNIYYPFWMSSKDYGFQEVNRGEQYYFFYQQFIARYYLERISNGFGETPFISWDGPVETPFYSSLEYPNGLEFPSRPAFANLNEEYRNHGESWTLKGSHGYSSIQANDYERRIDDVIDSGTVTVHGEKTDLYAKDGLNVLGNLIQANNDSPCYRYYGALWYYASILLGYSHTPLDKYRVAPSALEHFETAPRDPVFYQIYKRIVVKFQRYYRNIPAYKEKDLVFQGVRVKDFSVDRLVTYYDPFYFNLDNSVYYSPEEQPKNDAFNLRVRQYRLNNKPFTYKINVQSDKDTKSVVKVFLGPKYDEYGRYINLTENRLNFVLIDYFVQNLKSGENVISRNSYDSYYYAPDSTSYVELYKQVLASAGQTEVPSPNYFYFPRRLILPKGDSAGLPYQFYVIVYPYVPKEGVTAGKYESYFYPFEGEKQFYDSYSLGYPFDRFIKYEQLYYKVPNSWFQEAKIYHKDYVNVVQSD
ncbi:hypothetical protein NQ318_004862 [Aromia moschata]|uniref:Uncharacterized protein n=1 Tax=Aromia moschata TaxID=1265417 RepID=A0AAV8Z0D7_9CUCU|nr:hypothetical protein NQ318_004862 [Aromia moschata]